MTLKIAIVGRPNVGKSTLLNRLAGRKEAIVDDRPGVTRDRQEARATVVDTDYIFIDTAGFEDVHDSSLEARMRTQTEKAVKEADLVLFVVDAQSGIAPLDETFANLLRRSDKPICLLANKAEGRVSQNQAYDTFRLGFGEPLLISAEHGQGIGELKAWILENSKALLEKQQSEDEVETPKVSPLQLAIVGRPNAGKSTLINTLINEERLLTGPEAGITRDAIQVPYEYKGQPLFLIDTAGMRRKAKITDRLEKISVADTLNAIQFAQVVVLVVDATLGLDKQDFQIAQHVESEGRILIIALNKWDLIRDGSEAMAEANWRLQHSLAQLKDVPVIPVSATKGKNLHKLLDEIFTLDERWNRRISTGQLNRWLEDIIAHHPPPLVKGRRLKIRYLTQPKTRPPGFIMFVNVAKAFPGSYKKYLQNRLREDFDLQGIPLRLTLKSGENPYDKKD